MPKLKNVYVMHICKYFKILSAKYLPPNIQTILAMAHITPWLMMSNVMKKEIQSLSIFLGKKSVHLVKTRLSALV